MRLPIFYLIYNKFLVFLHIGKINLSKLNCFHFSGKLHGQRNFLSINKSSSWLLFHQHQEPFQLFFYFFFPVKVFEIPKCQRNVTTISGLTEFLNQFPGFEVLASYRCNCACICMFASSCRLESVQFIN